MVIFIIMACIKYSLNVFYINWKKIKILMCEINMIHDILLLPKGAISRKLSWSFHTFWRIISFWKINSVFLVIFITKACIKYPWNVIYRNWKKMKLFMFEMNMFYDFSFVPILTIFDKYPKAKVNNLSSWDILQEININAQQ